MFASLLSLLFQYLLGTQVPKKLVDTERQSIRLYSFNFFAIHHYQRQKEHFSKMGKLIEKIKALLKRANNIPEDLYEHIFGTYSSLRLAMGILGIILPPLIVIGGAFGLWWLSSPLGVQNSLSAYYHAKLEIPDCSSFGGVYRDLFVGLLAAISICLVTYKGYNNFENWLLNLAGISLAGVAFFPTSWPEPALLNTCRTIPGFEPFEASKLLGLPISIHTAAAVVFFIAITIVNVFTAMITVDRMPEDTSQQKKKKAFWQQVFQFAKWLMPIAIGLVLLIKLFTGTLIIGGQLVLWVEWAGIWAFAIYWLLKSVEILQHGGDQNS
ncbi:MAG: hypothetical protein AAGG02_06365 [Cyanobacteria bacterium P01_H01_bin.15]